MAKTERPVIALSDSSTEGVSKIETIKNLIFGEQMQAYESEFEQLKKDMVAKKTELDNLINQVRDELNESIDNLSTDLNIRIIEVEDNLKNQLGELENDTVLKKELGNILVSIGEKIAKK